MICRQWRGWTTREQADEYQALLTGTIIPMIEGRHLPGFLGIDTMRRDLGEEIEFQTLMWFEDEAGMRAFVGEDSSVSHIPDAAAKVLKRWDERAIHWQVAERRGAV
ncbi:MAG: antibiotic biosynthesis monooxygenase [Pseudomonadota bacterium]